MSFTKQKDSDNYETDYIGWDIIKEFIPQDKKYGHHFIVLENKRNFLQK